MMKKMILSLALAAICVSAAGWGRLGHATIAEIAERHLTPRAKANIEKYTGGTPLAEYGSWLDKVRNDEPYKTRYAGWHASIATTECSSPLYIRIERRNGGKDAVTGAEYLRAYLKDYKEMPDSIVLESIKALVHIIGDFHCPAHVRYTDARNDGKFKVIWFGKEKRLHDTWDSDILRKGAGFKAGDHVEYADRLDTWSKKQIKQATRGWAREWFEDAARDIRPLVGKAKPGDELGQEWVDNGIVIAENQIRKAGYQLAAALNEIFGE